MIKCLQKNYHLDFRAKRSNTLVSEQCILTNEAPLHTSKILTCLDIENDVHNGNENSLLKANT